MNLQRTKQLAGLLAESKILKESSGTTLYGYVHLDLTELQSAEDVIEGVLLFDNQEDRNMSLLEESFDDDDLMQELFAKYPKLEKSVEQTYEKMCAIFNAIPDEDKEEVKWGPGNTDVFYAFEITVS
jgi:hypothetical protein